MQETEITVQVFEDKKDLFESLKILGYTLVKNYQLNDWYFTKLGNLSGVNFQDLINNSILVREIIEGDETVNQICYKKKFYDNLGNVTSEEKTKTNVEDINKLMQILTLAGLNNYCNIRNDSYIFAKNNQEMAVQVVDDLGIFIEYEEDDSIPQNMSSEEKFRYMIKVVKDLGLKIGSDFSCKKVLLKLKKTTK